MSWFNNLEDTDILDDQMGKYLIISVCNMRWNIRMFFQRDR